MMKFSINGKKIFCVCVIIGGMLMSCTSETPAAGNDEPAVVPPSSIYKMSMDATGNRLPDLRASVVENSMDGEPGSSNIFRWDKGDSIMIWAGHITTHLTACRFTTSEGGLSTARFEYEGDKVDSRIYFGYYPYTNNINYNGIDINVPTDGSIIQESKNDSHHLGAYRPMYTTIVTRDYDSEELTGMEFRHLTGLIYFRIRNKSGKVADIESVSIHSTSNVFPGHAVLQFTPETSGSDALFQISGASKSEILTLSLGKDKTGVPLDNEEIMQAFLPVLPVEDLSGTRIRLILKADGREHVSLELDGNDVKAFEKAHYYKFGLTLKADGIEVDSVIADWEPGWDMDIPAI